MWTVGKTVVTAGQQVYGNSVLSAQFCCKPKTSLKSKIYLNKNVLVLLKKPLS